MKHLIMTNMRLLVVLLLAVLGAVGLFEASRTSAAQQPSLPDGPGSDIAQTSCLACHGPEPIAQQHLPRAKWQGEVEKMERWGAEVPPDKKNALIDYLAANFGARQSIAPRAAGPLPGGEGIDVVKESCLACHGPEPITQQRLTSAQWTGEVEKMVRWGADVPADKKKTLIDYLAKNFPSKN
jgi:mono/diheme cytochrome c family protein